MQNLCKVLLMLLVALQLHVRLLHGSAASHWQSSSPLTPLLVLRHAAQLIASFEDDGGLYNQADAGGFIKLQALRLRTLGVARGL